ANRSGATIASNAPGALIQARRIVSLLLSQSKCFAIVDIVADIVLVVEHGSDCPTGPSASIVIGDVPMVEFPGYSGFCLPFEDELVKHIPNQFDLLRGTGLEDDAIGLQMLALPPR